MASRARSSTSNASKSRRSQERMSMKGMARLAINEREVKPGSNRSRSRREPRGERKKNLSKTLYTKEIKEYTAEEVARHNTSSDLWIIIDMKVYDVTQFQYKHPGSESVLLQHAGADCTDDFEAQGHSKDAVLFMEEFLVGTLRAASSRV